MSIAITGASGFLGRHLIAHFLEEGHDVIALTRNPAALDDVSHANLRVVATNYDPTIANHLDAGCRLIHLAARRNQPTRRSGTFEHANVTVPEIIARAAIERDASRIVYASTALVFGPSDQPREAAAPLDESSTDAYVRTRVAGLLAIEDAASDAIPLISLLPSIIFGPDFPRARNRITTHMRRLLRSRTRIGVGADARRNLVYVDDVTRSIAYAATSEIASGRYLVSGENVTQDELERATRAAASMSAGARIVMPGFAAVAASRVADVALRFDKASGWTSRMRTLTAAWCVRPYTILGDHEPTPFLTAVRQTVATLEGVS